MNYQHPEAARLWEAKNTTHLAYLREERKADREPGFPTAETAGAAEAAYKAWEAAVDSAFINSDALRRFTHQAFVLMETVKAGDPPDLLWALIDDMAVYYAALTDKAVLS